MITHRFSDDDLRILATLAIDLCVDHLPCEITRQVVADENYWEIEVKFAVSDDEFKTNYEGLYINSGRDNDPTTYQMSWTTMRDGKITFGPISCPLVVVHFFEEMCNKDLIQMN